MGDEVEAVDGSVVLTLHTVGTRDIINATLIRDGEVIHKVEGSKSRDLRASFTDRNLTKGTHWYYWRVQQDRPARSLPGNLMPAHGPLAWSSPHWVVVE